ncbi:jg99, partial [Pararge aegeria aegeria]
TIEDLSQNPFLSHLLGINKIKPTTESSLNRETKLLDVNKNYRQDFKLTTVKPSTELLFSSSRKLETSTKIPRTGQRGRDRYISNFDSKSTEKPSTERATVTYSTRQYQTISRQRSRINLNDIKSTTALVAIVTSTEKPEVSSTVKPYTNGLYKQNFRIETTTAKTTTNTPKTSYYNITESSKVPLRLTTTPIPQTTSRTEITRMPETSSTTNNLGRSQTNGRQYTMGSTNTTTTTTSNNQQQSKSRPEVTNKPQTTTHHQHTTSTKRRLDTNSTPQTTTPKTSGTKTTTHGPQTKSRPVTTSKPQTTILSGSSRRFWAETPNFTSTTLLPRVTRNRPTNLTLTSSTKYYSTSQKPALTSTTIAATAKTTISIFDLYLKPSTQPTFKPFQFTTSNSRRPYKLSIFSGGTTSPPPNYFTTKKPSTEVVRKTNTQNI